ncbi:short-chain dehydrogenase [Xylariaceae sp. FL0662B]|nr:short-chain dehydrogenase [Xylariaceae sp. FL0662B]
MARTLEGKLAIVTGGSRGIGAAIAEKLASYGANVVLGHAWPSEAGEAKEEEQKISSTYGVRTLVVQADLSTPEGPKALIAAARAGMARPDKTFQIDILINNAGVALNNPLPDITPDQFETSYRTNVLGPLLVTQAAAPFLPHDRSGRIVNISSISASGGYVEQSVYGGTKAALEAMTRTWARELSERAVVNAVNPGPVMGPMYASNSLAFRRDMRAWIAHAPLMRARPGVDAPEVFDDPETKATGCRLAYTAEIAAVVAMLCGPDAAWCTGQVVCANGGMLM